MEVSQEGGKWFPTPGYYFLFFGQDQLVDLDSENIKDIEKKNIMNKFISNLIIDEELKEDIKNGEYEDNLNKNIIKNIKEFNNIYKNEIKSDKKIIILKYLYYIFYLINVYNYKETEKYIINRLIYNELFNKFNIKIKDLDKIKIKSKLDIFISIFNEKVVNKNDIFLFDENIINKLYKNYNKELILLLNILIKIKNAKNNLDLNNKKKNNVYQNCFIDIKTLYSLMNISIIELIENPDKQYKFKEAYVPDYNSIIQKIIFSFIIANNSDLIKLCIIEDHSFHSALKKIIKNKDLKEKLYSFMKKRKINKKSLDDVLTKLEDPEKFPLKLKYNNIVGNTVSKKGWGSSLISTVSAKFNKKKHFFHLNYLTGYKSEEDFLTALKDTKDVALKIMNKIRDKTKQNYDSYIVFQQVVKGNNKYLYSHIFTKELDPIIQKGGVNALTVAFMTVFSPVACVFLIIWFMYYINAINN